MRIPSKMVGFYEQLDQVDDSGQLSSLLRSYAVVKFSNEIQPVSSKQVLQDLLTLAFQLVKGIFWSSKKIHFQADLPIFTFMSKRPHLYKMNDLLAHEYKEECNRVFFYKPEDLTQEKGFVLAGLPHKIFGTEVRNNWKSIRKARKLFKVYLKAEGLSLHHRIPFWVHTIRQYAALGSYKDLFRRLKFPFVVCEYDQYNQVAAFMMAAREFGIPTYTQVHGLLNTHFAYTPLIANKVFAWGNYHKRLLESWGVPENHILISGATQYHPYPDIEREERQRILKALNLEEQVMVVATNPMKEEIRAALIEFVLELAAELPLDWSVIIRPHPSESLAFYEAPVKGKSNIQVMNNAKLSMANLMQIANTALVWNSAFGIDTMVNRIQTFQMKLHFPDDGEVSRLVEQGLIPAFKRPSDLIRLISSKPEVAEGHSTKISSKEFENFRKEYCANFGALAAQKMLQLIKENK